MCASNSVSMQTIPEDVVSNIFLQNLYAFNIKSCCCDDWRLIIKL
jgi:hypothetical protein